MTRIPINEARQNFADLVKRASEGESFTVTRYGKALAVVGPPKTKAVVVEFRGDSAVVSKVVSDE